MQTHEEIEKLKDDWLYGDFDYGWKIEETEGFEDHKEELLAFRLKIEKKRKKDYKEKLVKTAKSLKLGNNLHLTQYIMELTDRIKRLAIEVDELKTQLRLEKIRREEILGKINLL